MKRCRRYFLWTVPLLAWSLDAQAWGLYTHVFFAQALLWLVPLAHPLFRRAARRHPELVLAGACLPDLALVAPLLKVKVFDASHEWEQAVALLQKAEQSGSDEARALALGFASHLLTDIFAHNHFVPAHERVWADVPLATHLACEWALDHEVAAQLYATPGELLTRHARVAADFLVMGFGLERTQAARCLGALARADRLLRFSGLPKLAHGLGDLADRRMRRRFHHALSHTLHRLGQLDRLIQGERPQWHANPPRLSALAGLAHLPQRRLRSRMPMPRDVFVPI